MRTERAPLVLGLVLTGLALVPGCSDEPPVAPAYASIAVQISGDSFPDLVDTRTVVPVGPGLLLGGRSDGLLWIDLRNGSPVPVSRFGEGPAEYGSISNLAPGRDPDEGLVSDRRTGRLLRVTTGGITPELNAEPLPMLANGGFRVLGAASDGIFAAFDPPERDSDGVGHVVRVAPGGAEIDSVLPFASKTYLSAERSASTEVTSVFVPQPFAPDDLVTLTERGRVLILDSRGAIVRVYSETGDLQDTLVVIRPPEVEIVEEDIAPVIERFGSFFSESSIRAEAHYPLFDGVHAGRGSSLALGSLGGPGATSQTALLLSDVPSVLGVLQFPPGSRIVGFAPPLVVVARGGSLGLTRLVTYCITDDIWAAYVYDRSRASELVCPSRGD